MTEREYNRFVYSEWRRAHPERERARKREWYARNRERVNAERRERYANDPEYRAERLYTNDCSRIRRVRERAAE